MSVNFSFHLPSVVYTHTWKHTALQNTISIYIVWGNCQFFFARKKTVNKIEVSQATHTP